MTTRFEIVFDVLHQKIEESHEKRFGIKTKCHRSYYYLGLEAEQATGCLSGPVGLGGKILKYQNIYGITSLVIVHAYSL